MAGTHRLRDRELDGITDVEDMLAGPHQRSYAVSWIASVPPPEKVARRVSPIQYVRPGLPPILTVHGDADPSVPHVQAVQLHEALTKAGVMNRLLTIPRGSHGPFSPDERVQIYQATR